MDRAGQRPWVGSAMVREQARQWVEMAKSQQAAKIQAQAKESTSSEVQATTVCVVTLYSYGVTCNL
jgi:hypothetical protein